MGDLPSGMGGGGGEKPSGMGAGLGAKGMRSGAAVPDKKATVPVSFSSAPMMNRGGEIPSGMSHPGEGALTRKEAEVILVAPTRPRTVRIIGDDNGWGLSRDRSIISRAFEDSGWTVLVTNRFDATPLSIVTVNVHLEIPVSKFFVAAKWNVLVPNPEWWLPQWNDCLRHPSSIVWAKTADAYRIYRDLGAKVTQVGFRSVDKHDKSVVRERVFLHVAGNAPNKGTALLVSTWRKEWAPLIVVGTDKLLKTIKIPSWVTRFGRITDEDVKKLQNRCLFHIYPSKYEGFGHAQWEGLSCGAIVIIPDVPPFDTWPAAFSRISATNLTAAVAATIGLTDEEVAARSEAGRAAWEGGVESFRTRVKAEIATVDDFRAPRRTNQPSKEALPPVVDSVPCISYGRAGVLSDLPPMSYVGRVNCVTGYGAQARHQIHALRHHGLKLAIADSGSTHSPDPHGRDPFVKTARHSDVDGRQTKGTIFHIGPSVADEWRRKSFPRPHILVSAWETTRLPAKWVGVINAFDQVWCPTQWQREAYRASGVHEKLLKVVPFALDPMLYSAAGGGLPDVRREGYVFGSVLQWTERKNPAALIGSFLHAFEGVLGVTLVIKGYEGDSPSTSVAKHVEQIAATFRAQSRPKIQVISRPLSNAEMFSFYRSIDCYVSAHRGEGFGLPIAEALLMSKPVIATNWSAPAEFAAGCFRGVGYVLEPPRGMDWQPFYTVDQLWAHVDSSALAVAMREARNGRVTCPVERVKEQFAKIFDDAGKAAAVALGGL